MKKCGHTTKQANTPPNNEQPNSRRKEPRKIIWVSPPFNLYVLTKRGKNIFESDREPLSPLKIFNRNTVKVSYSCTQNMSQIIKGHNKKIFQKETQEILDCNCCPKADCPLNGDSRKKSVIYKCRSATCD